MYHLRYLKFSYRIIVIICLVRTGFETSSFVKSVSQSAGAPYLITINIHDYECQNKINRERFFPG